MWNAAAQQTGSMASRWRSRIGSIRTRIVVGYVVLVAVALAITLVVARGALVARFDNEIENRLAAEVDQLEVVIAEGNPDTGQPFTDAEVLFDTHLQRVLPGDDAAFFTLVDGEPYNLSFDAPDDLLADPALVEEWAATASSSFETVSSDAGPVRTLVVPVALDDNTGTFVVAVFTENSQDDLDDVFRTLALVGTVALLASALIALGIAARVVRPIRELTALARTVTDEDLSARIPVDGDDELAELSATFNAMMSRLEDGFSAQRAFLDDVAHELRTPITIIQGHLDLLDDDPDERTATIAVLNDELSRMNRYVDDLLILAQAERPDFLQLSDIDLDLLAPTLLDKARGLADRDWRLDATAIGVAALDEQRISQAVLNLAHNAARHTEHGDEIGIGVESTDSELSITVRDTGSGVDPDIVDDVFVRHMRSAASRTAGGTGLGLSIVDAIATAHGGTVAVESAPGHGATFTITIPTAPRPVDIDPAEEPT